MQYVSDWIASDDLLLLNFSDEVLKVFQSYVQTGSRPESGGILLGTVHDRGILVTKATRPSRFDLKFPYLFDRAPFGHRAIARRQWQISKGTVRYIGEWHTHPQDKPYPSGLDLHEWGRLAACRQDGRSLLSVIVGRNDLYVAMTAADRHQNQLKPYSVSAAIADRC
ncbi:Mov34/MPN/PAD-1 family protein [Achromobacter aloeverae]